MDEIDIAQRHSAMIDRMALASQLSAMPAGESAEECEDCGEPIPEPRRQAARGCTRCLLCQEHFERSKR